MFFPIEERSIVVVVYRIEYLFSLLPSNLIHDFALVTVQHDLSLQCFLGGRGAFISVNFSFISWRKGCIWICFRKVPLDDVFSFRLFFPSVSELLLYFVLKETTIWRFGTNSTNILEVIVAKRLEKPFL